MKMNDRIHELWARSNDLLRWIDLEDLTQEYALRRFMAKGRGVMNPSAVAYKEVESLVRRVRRYEIDVYTYNVLKRIDRCLFRSWTGLPQPECLTDTQHRVVWAINKGMNQADTARQLGVSRQAVHACLRRVRKALTDQAETGVDI